MHMYFIKYFVIVISDHGRFHVQSRNLYTDDADFIDVEKKIKYSDS